MIKLTQNLDIKAATSTLLKTSNERFTDSQLRVAFFDSLTKIFECVKEGEKVTKRTCTKLTDKLLALGFEKVSVELDQSAFGIELKFAFDDCNEQVKIAKGWQDFTNEFDREFVNNDIKYWLDVRTKQHNQIAIRQRKDIKKDLTRLNNAFNKFINELGAFNDSYLELQYQIKSDTLARDLNGNSVYLGSFIGK